ncbi:MAG TPA: helix-hairpin-helix domain-containing protein [Candidatus Eisenbacteria bacterium]|nr:helix-hairpin-helix domain-containing protein [Candidatus Eisenbacteria bacterium]
MPGIGPVLARRIVEHRREHGPFRSPEELRAVRGIGPKLYARLRPYLLAGRADTAAP